MVEIVQGKKTNRKALQNMQDACNRAEKFQQHELGSEAIIVGDNDSKSFEN